MLTQTTVLSKAQTCGAAVLALISGTLGHSDAKSAVSVRHECHVCSLGLLAGYWVRAIVQDFQRLHANQQLTHNLRKMKKRNMTRPKPHCLFICLFLFKGVVDCDFTFFYVS